MIRSLLDGEAVSHAGARYRLDAVRHAPRPVQPRLPLLIGGGGERRTLRTVAAHADMWNVVGTPEMAARKPAILNRHCADLGRDPAEIGRSVTVKLLIRDSAAEARRAWAAQLRANGMNPDAHPDALLDPPDAIAAALCRYRALGFDAVIADAPAPYDHETIERLATEVPRWCAALAVATGKGGHR